MSSMIVPKGKTRRAVFIVAGEASGDLHGAGLVREMKKLDPTLTFSGVGGKRMEAEGVRLVARSAEMAVVGITEVFTKIRFILGIFFRIRKILREEKPGLLVLIDYPDFNLRLAAVAKRAGVPVFYYISPQIWAWRKGRVKQIRRVVDRMAVILPFEKAFYAERDFHADFVGHPLLDVAKRSRSREKALVDFGLLEKHPIVALLPGSREKEVKSLLPIMLGASVLLKENHPDAQFILPLAETVDAHMAEQILRVSPLSVKIISGQTYDAVGLADVALVTSGTATLETALLEIPMVIVYRISALTAAIGKRLIRLKHIGLVNIIADEAIVPELVQEKATSACLAREALKILADGDLRQAIHEGLTKMRHRLGERGASLRAARIALQVMEKHRF